MKIGVCIPHHRDIMPVEDVMAVPARAEAAGFDSVWVNDHVVIPNETLAQGFTPGYHDSFMVLAFAAARTQRVKLGTTVLVLPYRHPLVQAKMLATLDVLSGGRVILGTGVGWSEGEYRALNIPFSERGARADETLAILNELWTSDNPSFSGRFFQFSDIQFAPKPAQQPRIPIWIGGAGPAALRRVAQYGDAWHPGERVGFDGIQESMPALKEQWRRFGREGEPAVTLRLTCRVYPVAREGRRPPGHGTVEQVIADLERARSLGIEYAVVDFVRTGSTTPEQWNYCFEAFAHDVLPRLG